MRLIVGLGNPGDEYSGTRHNVGFAVVDSLAGDAGWKLDKAMHAEIVKNSDAILVKPQTFMNNSGRAVRALMDYYKIEPADVWIVHDDLDLPLGKAQIRTGGGTAGHHGLESIIEHIKTADFGRVRIGIRGQGLRELHAQQGIATDKFVLGRFSGEEKEKVEAVVDLIVGRLRIPDVLEHIETGNYGI